MRRPGRRHDGPPRSQGMTSVWAQYRAPSRVRDRLAATLNGQGIPTAIYYPKPVHRQQAYREFPIVDGLPVSDQLARGGHQPADASLFGRAHPGP